MRDELLSDRIAVGRALWRELVIGFAEQLGSLDVGFTQLAALYAIVNIHHFVLDGAIWKLRDGRVARMTHSTSKFGMEYDSIADTVSFGVAPAMLAFAAGNLGVLGRPGWVMVFLFTACAALRLARFNVSPGRYRGRFEGMPSPAAAGVVADRGGQLGVAEVLLKPLRPPEIAAVARRYLAAPQQAAG